MNLFELFIPLVLLVLGFLLYRFFRLKVDRSVGIYPNTLNTVVVFTLSNILISIALMFGVSLLVVLVSEATGSDQVRASLFDLPKFVLVGATALFIYIFSKKSKVSFREVIGDRWIGIESFVWILALAFFGRLLFSQVSISLGMIRPPDHTAYEHWNLTVFGALSTIVLAPVIEEIFYRSYLLKGLMQKFEMTFSVVVVSLLFALAHWPGSVLQPFLLAIAASLLYINTRSIFAPIAAHLGFNILAEISKTPVAKMFLATEGSTFTYNTWTLTVAANIFIFAYILRDRWLNAKSLADPDNFVL